MFDNPLNKAERPDRDASKDELLRLLRMAVAAEYEAVNMYEQMAEACTDPAIAAVLLSVAREELVHVGEFMQCIAKLSQVEQDAYREGMQEAARRSRA